ncbi:thiamine ABC transporter substrate binding subunit [Pseudooceanicola nanhaiensis]|uniref:thiamine ABC transporter substrate binding subunit n=1 Tax=Pseudooceanicola nanhaiensis TaxID=375761 RepID=UPI001CD624C0|nr:thiamine ABC transporter substrate binding subunit [Pseudooceanicola nanhaiensis]MCA0920425.1 thiamine ABC transporter substrate binding subunit [Pseudooceanicola nanhaiensis]
MRHLAIAAGLLMATQAAAQTPELTVYTYDSLATEWGPGPVIEAEFEKTCGCDVTFVTAGDGAALLSRLRLEGARTEADVVLGLDTALMGAAAESGLFAPSGVTADYSLPIDWTDETFVPFDWGYFAFVGLTDGPQPTSFRALADSDASIVIEDPRSSTPGLGLLLWVKQAYGDEAPAIWEALADNIVTVTPGWSEAYGLFLEGEADLVMSYTTSPAYHLIAEDDATKTALAFDEGNYMQVEVAAALASTDQPELAQQFLQFLTGEAVQSAIPTTNWMYPAVTPAAGLPEGYETLTVPATPLLMPVAEAQAARDAALEEWRAALAQ